jgi:hypothetical protein
MHNVGAYIYLRESHEEAAIGDGDFREKIEYKHYEGTPVVHRTKQPVHIVDTPQPKFHEEVPVIKKRRMNDSYKIY